MGNREPNLNLAREQRTDGDLHAVLAHALIESLATIAADAELLRNLRAELPDDRVELLLERIGTQTTISIETVTELLRASDPDVVAALDSLRSGRPQ